MAEPKLTGAPVRLVAATLPGYGNPSPPDDLSMETYASLAGRLAADVGCEAVLGHSVGANVAIEMAAAGEFTGPLALLSPSFSREDESKFPRALDRVGRVLGHLPYAAMFRVIGPAMKGSLPADRHAALVAELKKNDPRFVRRHTRRYLEYLDSQQYRFHGQAELSSQLGGFPFEGLSCRWAPGSAVRDRKAEGVVAALDQACGRIGHD